MSRSPLLMCFRPSRESKAPMPSIVFASSSTSSAPAAVVQQQTVRILRRPNGSSPSASQNASMDDVSKGYNTLKTRQAAYDAARARIFGDEASSLSSTNDSTLSSKVSEQPRMMMTERRETEELAVSPLPRRRGCFVLTTFFDLGADQCITS